MWIWFKLLNGQNTCQIMTGVATKKKTKNIVLKQQKTQRKKPCFFKHHYAQSNSNILYKNIIKTVLT